MNKKSLMISVITIVGVLCILVGSIAYYRITVSGNIKGSTGNAVFNVTGFTNESTKEIVLKEGKLIPGDKGEFTLHLDATNSSVDMYVTLSIDRSNLPTNLKFYTTSDRKSELHKYYEFMDTSNQSKDLTIYWYWNPYIDDEEDSSFINNTDVTATIKLDAVQISEYAMMKNGSNATYDSYYDNFVSNGTEFWNETYRNYIRTISFINDLSNLPEVCDEANLCWDISYEDTQNKKVYAYLIDSGLDYTDSDSVVHDLYNLYIASEAPIFAPTDCSLIFAKFEKLESINFNNDFNTSNVTDMYSMFLYCRKLTDLDLSSFNTSNVTDMSNMFFRCTSLTRLDLSSFNTSNVTDMNSMFANCSAFMKLDLSSFNTSNVTNMKLMFTGLRLTSLDLSSFNTSNVTDMSNMFQFCSRLTSLDLSGFNTSKVINMLSMFNYCISLVSLDISSFNTSSVTNMTGIFYDCSSLTSLDLSNFNTSNVTNMYGMFYGCSKLTTTINIMGTGVTSYTNMFSNAATAEGVQIIVNYIADASTLVDNMIATKSETSNVVKGNQI